LLLTVPNFHAVRKPPMLPECNARIRREWRLPKKRRRMKRSAADGTGDAGGARPGLPGPRLPRGPPGRGSSPGGCSSPPGSRAALISSGPRFLWLG
jgi:hypothetical protein